MSVAADSAIDFELPDALAAREPPEARGRSRADVRLMVSDVGNDSIIDTTFRRLPEFVSAGDVLVVNASATFNAALKAHRSHENVLLHLSTQLSPTQWVVELRRVNDKGSAPLLDAEAGETVLLAAGGTARLRMPFRGSARLWVAEMNVGSDVVKYAGRHGSPIRYAYMPGEWPLSYYQTIFAREPGSAEMPSAGRAFTRDTVARLRAKGVVIASIVLHAGVASLELEEPPYPERYRVPARTAALVNRAHAAERKVIAVGTTVVRALETVAEMDGRVRTGSGWTDIVIKPERGVFAVDALLTGFHAPRASHLHMLAAFAGQRHLRLAYAHALEREYRWHEFGDLHLILPNISH